MSGAKGGGKVTFLALQKYPKNELSTYSRIHKKYPYETYSPLYFIWEELAICALNSFIKSSLSVQWLTLYSQIWK